MSILCYHAVQTGWQAPLAVTPEAFEAHCRWLAGTRRVLPLSAAVAALDRRWRLPARTVCLTFDDGFASVYEHAWPTLRRYALPAAVFLVAETLTPRGRPVDWVDIPPEGDAAATLTVEQILELREQGVEFGSHSFAHRDLTLLDERECLEDLRSSRELLSDLLGEPVLTLAYPRGRHDAKVRGAARAAGYTHAFALPQGPEPAGPYAVPRVGIHLGNGTLTLRAKASRPYLPLRTGDAWRAVRPLARMARRLR